MVSHLLFADDILPFSKLILRVHMKLMQFLYYNTSDQQVSMDISSIHFAKRCQENVRQRIMDILNVHNVSLSEKYLWMTYDVGTTVNGDFKYLRDQVMRINIGNVLDEGLRIGERGR
jgi:hypothetical protein